MDKLWRYPYQEHPILRWSGSFGFGESPIVSPQEGHLEGRFQFHFKRYRCIRRCIFSTSMCVQMDGFYSFDPCRWSVRLTATSKSGSVEISSGSVWDSGTFFFRTHAGAPQYTTDTLREPMRVVVFRHFVLVTEYDSNRIVVLTPNYEKTDELMSAGALLCRLNNRFDNM